MSFFEIGSSNDRPISRLIAKIVRSGLVTACRLAGWPTRRSPSSVNATIDGVVRAPSEFSITLGVEPSMTATHELVVPRSMPITFAIFFPLFHRGTAGPQSARALKEAFRRALRASGLALPIPVCHRQISAGSARFAPEPASPGVYRGGDLAAQGAEAADFSSFGLVVAGRPTPSPFIRTPLDLVDDSTVSPPHLRLRRRGARSERGRGAIASSRRGAGRGA